MLYYAYNASKLVCQFSYNSNLYFVISMRKTYAKFITVSYCFNLFSYKFLSVCLH